MSEMQRKWQESFRLVCEERDAAMLARNQYHSDLCDNIIELAKVSAERDAAIQERDAALGRDDHGKRTSHMTPLQYKRWLMSLPMEDRREILAAMAEAATQPPAPTATPPEPCATPTPVSGDRGGEVSDWDTARWNGDLRRYVTIADPQPSTHEPCRCPVPQPRTMPDVDGEWRVCRRCGSQVVGR